MTLVPVVSCPTCQKPVRWDPAGAEYRWRPFCSERCKLADLGAWASEQYRVPSVAPPEGDEP